MPKGPRTTDEIRRFIAEIHDKHPDWRAKEVRHELWSMLHQVNHQMAPEWPGLSVVQVELRKIRQRKASGQPFDIDKFWSVGRLADYNIPYETIPKVLEIQELRHNYEPLTIREAQWIGRLHAITKDVITLAIWATLYAERERICEQAGVEKNTSDIDHTVRSGYTTLPFYFHWLFRQGWIPNSYKKQVAEEQTQQYENTLGIKVERPHLTTNGWLLYADSLQQMLLRDNTAKNQPKTLRQLEVLVSRLIAKNEGQILSSPGKYIDALEIWATGQVREKPLESSEKVLMYSENPSKRFAEELRKFSDPDLADFTRKNAGDALLEAINKITGSTEHMKSKHDLEGGNQ